ncbi:MAG TPA: phosphatidylserine/phosphatidylglycerophosphate/cardiolipin synthase family protein [Gaiella sp.]|nr:phosphatidylserine/phosphatidylglycerophosphate/cardiolipin synthase family protein [Gaiella sp.]
MVVGVFCTWLTQEDLTLNGIEGPNNGWLCVLLAGPALLWTRMMERGSSVGLLGVLASALVIGWTATESWLDGRDVLNARVSHGLLLVLVACAVLAAVAVARTVPPLRGSARNPRPAAAGRRSARAAAAVVSLLSVLLFVLVFRQVLGITQEPSWPPPADAVSAAQAQAATERFAARDGARPHDAVLDFAWSTAATIEPWPEGSNFFPRILADVDAARSSVHVLMFGWREGEIGTQMAALLERKMREGVEVRVIVDRFGSRPYAEAREMFEGLAAAGAQIVVNDVLPVDRDGLYPDDRDVDWRQDEVGRADHRKLYVVDGEVAWTGGAGLEDHFENGGFHDVMVRVTGDVVRQAQAAFLTSFRGHGGPLPDDLDRYFPEPADAGSTPVALAQVIPGGFVAASQAIRAQIDGARERLDVMNPYLTDRDMLERIIAAARRGVRVRIVVSETSNNAQAAAALKHRYEDLIEAGVEIWELPGTVVHAKVVVADDVVSFGTVNLDSWALYRNSEIAIIARSADVAALFEKRLFEPDIARSRPGEPPSGTAEELESWLWDKLAYFL